MYAINSLISLNDVIIFALSYCLDYNKKKARVDAVLYMVQDPSVVPNSGNTLGSTFDAMSAFQLRAYDKCPNETAEYGYSLDTDSGTGVY